MPDAAQPDGPTVAPDGPTLGPGHGGARVRSKRLAALVGPVDVEPGRVFYHNLWFKGHDSPRYEPLLAKLDRVDPYLVTCSERRVVRAVQYRTLRATRALRHRVVFGLAARHYWFTFSTDLEQVPYIRGPVVVDVDDPPFTPEHARLLNRPNVRAFVVTAERAAERYRELGVRTRHHVIPQGVDVGAVDRRAEADALAIRLPGEVAVGYLAAWLLAGDDRGGDNPLYNTDHLFELWDQIVAAAPTARLWLVGRASDRVRRRCARRDDVVLVGQLPQSQALAYVKGFDIGLYPRSADQGIQAVKVAEYLGLGVPVVTYDYAVTRMVGEAGAGVLAATPRQFVDAVVGLVHDVDRRRVFAAAAAAAGEALCWDSLARRYEREILDVHLR